MDDTGVIIRSDLTYIEDPPETIPPQQLYGELSQEEYEFISNYMSKKGIVKLCGKLAITIWFAIVYIITYSVLAIKSQEVFLDICTLYKAQSRFPPAIFLRGQVWRLICALFVHQNPVHLLGNTAASLYISSIIEYTWGSFTMFIIFFFIGVLCGCTSALVLPYKVGCGCSGPLLSFFGAYIVWLAYGPPENVANPEKHRWIKIWLGVFGLACTALADAFLSDISDWPFHWFSVLAGVLVAFVLLPRVITNTQEIPFYLCLQSSCIFILGSWIITVIILGLWYNTHDKILWVSACNDTETQG